jgi:hypothetical protein
VWEQRRARGPAFVLLRALRPPAYPQLAHPLTALTPLLQWHTYVGSTNNNRHGAMDVMINKAGLLKYDAVYNDTDTGVLMIRDFLLGVYADQYITCQGDFLADCAGCFRSNSNFISRLLTVRRGYEKNGMQLWFQMGQHDIATAASPRVLRDVRI